MNNKKNFFFKDPTASTDASPAVVWGNQVSEAVPEAATPPKINIPPITSLIFVGPYFDSESPDCFDECRDYPTLEMAFDACEN